MSISFVAASTALGSSTEVDTTITFTTPAGIIPGDVIFAWITTTDSGNVNSSMTNANYTLVGSVADAGSPTPYSTLWYRVVQAGDSTSAVWTATGGVTSMGASVMAAYRGVDPTTPVLNSSFGTLATTTTARATDALVTTATWVVSGFSDKTAGVNYTSPSGTIRGQTRQPTNGIPTAMIQDSNGPVTAGSQTMTAVGASTSVGNSFILSLNALPQATLMPAGGPETFTGTANTTLVGAQFTIPTNQGSGGHAQTNGTQGRIRTGTTVGNRTSLKINRATLADGEMVFDWVVPAASTMFPYFIARAGTLMDGDGGYWLAIQNGQIELNKFVPNYNGVTLTQQSYTFTPGNIMRTRVAIFGSRIRMRTWLASNPEVTSSWDMDFTDTGTQPTTGFWGFTNASNTSGSKDFLIDNLNLLDTITSGLATITVGGSMTPTGALNKMTIKKFVGSMTPTGALTKVRVVLRTFTGSMTPTGALRKVVNKTFTGSITPTGTIKRFVSKKFTGSMTPTGSVRKMIKKRFVGSMTPTGDVIVTAFGRVFGRPGIAVTTVRVVGAIRTRIRRG